MPFKSEAQRRFFELCKHHPEKARKKCPSLKVIEEYERADREEKESDEKKKKRSRRK